MNKILISDYDKTLFTDDINIQKNIESINKFREEGNIFVIATARSFESLKTQIEKYSINYDYLILGHGSVILNNKMKLVKKCTLDKNLFTSILKSIDKFKDVIDRIRLYDIYSEDVSFDSSEITKLRILTKNIEVAIEISNYLSNNYGSQVKSYVIDAEKYVFTEVISIKTDKGEAIEKILELEKIISDNVYTIGDGSNDIEMIQKYDGYGMTKSEQCVLDITNKLYDNVYNLIEDIMI